MTTCLAIGTPQHKQAAPNATHRNATPCRCQFCDIADAIFIECSTAVIEACHVWAYERGGWPAPLLSCLLSCHAKSCSICVRAASAWLLIGQREDQCPNIAAASPLLACSLLADLACRSLLRHRHHAGAR